MRLCFELVGIGCVHLSHYQRVDFCKDIHTLRGQKDFVRDRDRGSDSDSDRDRDRGRGRDKDRFRDQDRAG